MKVAWNHVPLGEIAPARSLPLPSAETTAWNLSLEDIEANTGRILNKQECRISDLGSSKCAFDARHVLYSKLRPYLNKVVLPDAPGVGTSELIPLQPDANRLDREFLAFYLRSHGFLDFANANTRGANLPRIAMAELWAHKVPVPSRLEEQRRIVARVKACMERVEEIEKLRKEATLEAKSVEYACFHDALLDGISQRRWKIGVLGDVTTTFRYGTSAKAHSQADGVPVLRMGNIQRGYLDFSDLKYIQLPSSEIDRYRLKCGDVLINRTNSLELVGKAATFTNPEGTWIYASYLVRADIDRTLASPEFVTAVINSRIGRDFVLRTARRAIGMVNLNAKEMAKFPLPLPTLKEQAEITELLDRARPLAEELRSTMAEPELQFIRQSVLQKAFAGEL